MGRSRGSRGAAAVDLAKDSGVEGTAGHEAMSTDGGEGDINVSVASTGREDQGAGARLDDSTVASGADVQEEMIRILRELQAENAAMRSQLASAEGQATRKEIAKLRDQLSSWAAEARRHSGAVEQRLTAVEQCLGAVHGAVEALASDVADLHSALPPPAAFAASPLSAPLDGGDGFAVASLKVDVQVCARARAPIRASPSPVSSNSG